jgi:hypothetical protein
LFCSPSPSHVGAEGEKWPLKGATSLLELRFLPSFFFIPSFPSFIPFFPHSLPTPLTMPVKILRRRSSMDGSRKSSRNSHSQVFFTPPQKIFFSRKFCIYEIRDGSHWICCVGRSTINSVIDTYSYCIISSSSPSLPSLPLLPLAQLIIYFVINNYYSLSNFVSSLMVTKLPWISFSPFKLERFNLAGLKEPPRRHECSIVSRVGASMCACSLRSSRKRECATR